MSVWQICVALLAVGIVSWLCGCMCGCKVMNIEIQNLLSLCNRINEEWYNRCSELTSELDKLREHKNE